jgi:hypothetical protein
VCLGSRFSVSRSKFGVSRRVGFRIVSRVGLVSRRVGLNCV